MSAFPELSLTQLPLVLCYTALQQLPTLCKVNITRNLPHTYFHLLYGTQHYSGYPHVIRFSFPEVSLTLLPLAVRYIALQRLPTRC